MTRLLVLSTIIHLDSLFSKEREIALIKLRLNLINFIHEVA